MIDKITTRPSTREYKEGWDRIFGGNTWKCPACGKKFDYGEGRPIGKSYCSETGKNVQMVKVERR